MELLLDWSEHDVIRLKPAAWEFPRRVDPKHSAATGDNGPETTTTTTTNDTTLYIHEFFE